jgi:nitroimidazol reductase NimA-like FMN-containing flavoprotein (pyridoxamine 5'-phosphate oxidase superfamily)
MAQWSDLAAAKPEVAAAGERLLRSFTVGYLATLRREGAPRIHPVTVTLHAGALYVSTIATSRKTADLARDPRYALHSFPRFPDAAGWNDEEFAVTGRARLVTDRAERGAVVAVHNDTVGEEDPFWELMIESAFHKYRVDGKPVHERWHADSANGYDPAP